MALETTLLVHGVPRETALPLFDELSGIVEAEGALPSLVGVVSGRPTVGMTRSQLAQLLEAPDVPKVNSANIGLAIHRKQHAATTVAGTMELAAAAGVAVFATGGLGGVHRGYGTHWDVSADLMAFARFPVAVVTAGVKAILDVVATREALETLGVPVIGYQTDAFPAFYLRESGAGVDARFDNPAELGAFVGAELRRTGRGIVVANPIPESDAIPPAEWDGWVAEARALVETQAVAGRAITPAMLSALVQVSGGRTLEANLALVRHNTRVAARLAVALHA
ncbi:MAG: pseudouridine-5'-phosphate glycosidase [Myxococcota bacterium]